MPHLRGYSALRRGRFSAPGCVYFLTICTADRAEALTYQDVSAAVREEISRMSSDNVWHVRAFTLMPDHVHILAELGGSLSLSQTVARLKAKTGAALFARDAKWQVNYFDHRLAAGESVLPILLYVYLNPYRKQLIKPSERWPWFYCRETEWSWFKDRLNDDLPEPAWLLLQARFLHQPVRAQ
jgi:REP element-mobilizing transposase RayT